MSAIVLLQDTREKMPLLFPAVLAVRGQNRTVSVKPQTLSTGDYAIEGAESLGLIERKGSLRELWTNFCTGDFPRVRRALVRLRDAAIYPALLLESGIDEILTPTDDVPNPGPVLQRFLDQLVIHRIPLLFVGSCKYPTRRRQVGEFVIRWLLAASEKGE